MADALIGPINTAALIEQYQGDARLFPQNIVALARALDRAQSSLALMIREYGAPHDPGCPQDDTCQCPAVDQINRALVGYVERDPESMEAF